MVRHPTGMFSCITLVFTSVRYAFPEINQQTIKEEIVFYFQESPPWICRSLDLHQFERRIFFSILLTWKT